MSVFNLLSFVKQFYTAQSLCVTYLNFMHIIRCLYRVIRNDCRGFNNLSYTIQLRYQYIAAPMDQEILRVSLYDVRCAVVMHFSACSAVP